MTRGPDGRYGCQAPADRRDPVAVTCLDCGTATTGAIWRSVRAVPTGATYMGVVLYDHVPVLLCYSCGERPEGAGHYWCGWCGRSVSYYGYGARPARYCTAACLRSARLARRRAGRSHARKCHCGSCGQPFTASRSDARYCSPPCRQKAYRDRLAAQAAERARDITLIEDYNEHLGRSA